MKRRLRELVRRPTAARGRNEGEASPSDGPQDPVVSLTFDDGLASHRIAAELLAERGLRGTFYAPSGHVCRKGGLGAGRPSGNRHAGTTDPSQFAELLDWLVARTARVMRVRDVASG